MLKLFKFELLRKRMVFLVALIMVVLGECYALFKYAGLDEAIKYFAKEDILGVFAVLLMMGFGILYLVDIITLLREDLFKQEGYMLFMTPFNGYQILGAKVLFALIEGFSIGLIFLSLIWANAMIMHIPMDFLSELGLSNSEIWIMAKGVFLGIIGIIEFALTVFLSFALFKSIFVNVRFKGAITFGIFIAINFIKGQIVQLLGNVFFKSFETTFNGSIDSEVILAIHSAMNISIVYTLIMSVILFIGTGYLLENKINL